MAALTLPWHPAAAGHLAGLLRHVHRVTAITPTREIPLALTTGTITMDEQASPRFSATLGLQIPDAATLDLLDPRRRVQIRIDAGYRLPGIGTDLHALATLDLYEAIVRRPAQDLILTLTGREMRLIDTVALTDGPLWTSSTDALTAIRWLLETFDPGTPIVHPGSLGSFVTGAAVQQLAIGDHPWTVLEAIAERVGVEVYEDGQGTWQIRRAPTIAGPTRAFLSTGPAGNVVSSESVRGRGSRGFYNTAIVKYEYMTASGPATSIGHASVTTGPGSVPDAGRVAAIITRQWRGTTADATREAASIVRRGISRGRSLSFEAAHAPYWVRPGDTIQVSLPTGPEGRHLVARTDIDLPSGAWHVRTRLPDDVTITEGE